MIQAVLFDRNKFTSVQARKWLKDHDYTPIKKAHVTAHLRRYRLVEPDASKYKYRTLTVADGIYIVYGAKRS